MRYRIIEIESLGVTSTTICLMNDDDSYTAFKNDETNSMYQAYLAWLAEGNTPEPWEANNGDL